MHDYNIKSIKEEFRKKGIFYSPLELALRLKGYVGFKPETVYDPTCGDGALLAVFDEDTKKYGQELNSDQLNVARKRLSNFTGYCGDTLADPAFTNMKFDCIVANPPFSVSWDPIVDERFASAPTVPTQSKADYAFIMHILHYLAEHGVAVVLNFPGILYRSGREGIIRQWLIENNYIDSVISVPPDTFVDTKIATVILILKKNKKSTSIMFDDGVSSKVIDVEKIRQNDYTLSVSNYIQYESKKEVIDPIELEMKARAFFKQKLIADLNFSKQVASWENLDLDTYLDELTTIITSFRCP